MMARTTSQGSPSVSKRYSYPCPRSLSWPSDRKTEEHGDIFNLKRRNSSSSLKIAVVGPVKRGLSLLGLSRSLYKTEQSIEVTDRSATLTGPVVPDGAWYLPARESEDGTEKTWNAWAGDLEQALNACTREYNESPVAPRSGTTGPTVPSFYCEYQEEDSGYESTNASSAPPSAPTTRCSSPCSEAPTEVTDLGIEENQLSSGLNPALQDTANRCMGATGSGNQADTGKQLTEAPEAQHTDKSGRKRQRQGPSGRNSECGNDQEGEDHTEPYCKQKSRRRRMITDGPRFSCPFRKRDHLKYNIRDHALCATSELRGFAQVKQHIIHFHRQSNPSVGPVDGVSDEIVAKLEQEAYRGIHDWETLWRNLFPQDCDVPSKEYIAPVELEEVILEIQESLGSLDYKVKQEVETLIPALNDLQVRIHSRMVFIFTVFITEAFWSCHNKFRGAKFHEPLHSPGSLVHLKAMGLLRSDTLQTSPSLHGKPEIPLPLYKSISFILQYQPTYIPDCQRAQSHEKKLPHRLPTSLQIDSDLPTVQPEPVAPLHDDQRTVHRNMSMAFNGHALRNLESGAVDSHEWPLVDWNMVNWLAGTTFKGEHLGRFQASPKVSNQLSGRPKSAEVPSPTAASPTPLVLSRDIHITAHPKIPLRSIETGHTDDRSDASNDLGQLYEENIDDFMDKICDLVVNDFCELDDGIDALSSMVPAAVTDFVNEILHLVKSLRMEKRAQGDGIGQSRPSDLAGYSGASLPHGYGRGIARNIHGRWSEKGDDGESDDGPPAPGGNTTFDREGTLGREPSYSCPFRKRNPSRFNLIDHEKCAKKGFARWDLLKRHVWQLHLRKDVPREPLYPCTTCKRDFDSETARESHAEQGRCVYQRLPDKPQVDPEDGITKDIEGRLKTRDGPNKVKDWKTLWKVIFPMDPDNEIPSKGSTSPSSLRDPRRFTK
ncbi:hypothetical protein F4780DRAFT_484770 [Xylariomycetidae sp. FL0641]|nr:hypothetical protein F4780DRAFT_484770 [Xylariomycetidae sp. FL0641]